MAGIPCGAMTGGGGTDGGAAAGCRDGGGWRTAAHEDGATTRGRLGHGGARGEAEKKKSNRYVCVTNSDGG